MHQGGAGSTPGISTPSLRSVNGQTRARRKAEVQVRLLPEAPHTLVAQGTKSAAWPAAQELFIEPGAETDRRNPRATIHGEFDLDILVPLGVVDTSTKQAAMYRDDDPRATPRCPRRPAAAPRRAPWPPAAVAKVQEGAIRSPAAAGRSPSSEQTAERLRTLIARINRTNLDAGMEDGEMLTAALARRDVLAVRHRSTVSSLLPPRRSRSATRRVRSR